MAKPKSGLFLEALAKTLDEAVYTEFLGWHPTEAGQNEAAKEEADNLYNATKQKLERMAKERDTRMSQVSDPEAKERIRESFSRLKDEIMTQHNRAIEKLRQKYQTRYGRMFII